MMQIAFRVSQSLRRLREIDYPTNQITAFCRNGQPGRLTGRIKSRFSLIRQSSCGGGGLEN